MARLSLILVLAACVALQLANAAEYKVKISPIQTVGRVKRIGWPDTVRDRAQMAKNAFDRGSTGSLRRVLLHARVIDDDDSPQAAPLPASRAAEPSYRLTC